MEKPNHRRTKTSLIQTPLMTSAGGNAFDAIKSLLFGVKDLSQKNRTFLKRYGNNLITKVVVQREPVNSFIMKMLNFLTFGGLQKALDNSKYEDLFHLSVMLVLDNGANVRLEKNEVITLSIQKKRLTKGAETKNIEQFPMGVSLNEALKKTKDLMGDKFATYDSKTNNCQNFILSFIHANGVKDWYDDFIKQDTRSIFTANPWLRTITRAITDPASRVSNAIQGGEIEISKPGSLKKHGYHLELKRGDRRKALEKAVAEYGSEKVIQKLTGVMNLSKDEKNKRKYKEDINYVKKM